MPYRFLEDIATADTAFEAWGDTHEAMFAAAAEAVLATMVEEPEIVAERREVDIRLENPELDLLLFAFLQELVYHKDADRLLLKPQEITIVHDGEYRLQARLAGEVIDRQRHLLLVDVKAVTLYKFRVAHEEGAWRCTVILDI